MRGVASFVVKVAIVNTTALAARGTVCVPLKRSGASGVAEDIRRCVLFPSRFTGLGSVGGMSVRYGGERYFRRLQVTHDFGVAGYGLELWDFLLRSQ